MKLRFHENRKTGNQETMESGFPEIKISCQQEIFQVRKHP
jgi:hypothetical protein